MSQPYMAERQPCPGHKTHLLILLQGVSSLTIDKKENGGVFDRPLGIKYTPYALVQQ